MNTKPRTTRRRNLSVTDDDYKTLQALGMGNASEGIRVALCYAKIAQEQRNRSIAATSAG